MKTDYRDYEQPLGAGSPGSFRAKAQADWLRAERQRLIREVAYFKAQMRRFAPGHEVEDWVEAEQEVDAVSRPVPRR